MKSQCPNDQLGIGIWSFIGPSGLVTDYLSPLCPFNENIRHLRPAEFYRRALSRLQHLANLRTTGSDFVFGAVWAGLGADDCFALFAPRGVLEFEDGHPDVLGEVELIE